LITQADGTDLKTVLGRIVLRMLGLNGSVRGTQFGERGLDVNARREAAE
jgi:hypothetical protein